MYSTLHKPFQQFINVLYLIFRADLSHRIPSHQPDQLIKQHLHKKQGGTRYIPTSSNRINFLHDLFDCTGA